MINVLSWQCCTSLCHGSLSKRYAIFKAGSLGQKSGLKVGFVVTQFPQNLQTRRHQVVIAQWLARQLATGEVLGSNPGKGDNLLISE